MRTKARSDQMLGVEVCDLGIDELSAADSAALLDVIDREGVVLLRDSSLTTESFLRCARSLGRPQVYPIDVYRHPEHPEIYVSSNLKINEKRFGVARTGD